MLKFQLTWQDCYYAVFQQQTSLTAKLRDKIDSLGSTTSKVLRRSTPSTPKKLERVLLSKDGHGVHKGSCDTSNTNDLDTDEGEETVTYVDSHGTLSDTTWPDTDTDADTDTDTLGFDPDSLAADPAIQNSSPQLKEEVKPRVGDILVWGDAHREPDVTFW